LLYSDRLYATPLSGAVPIPNESENQDDNDITRTYMANDHSDWLALYGRP